MGESSNPSGQGTYTQKGVEQETVCLGTDHQEVALLGSRASEWPSNLAELRGTAIYVLIKSIRESFNIQIIFLVFFTLPIFFILAR